MRCVGLSHVGRRTALHDPLVDFVHLWLISSTVLGARWLSRLTSIEELQHVKCNVRCFASISKQSKLLKVLSNVFGQSLVDKLICPGKADRTVAAQVFGDRLVDVHPCFAVYLLETAVLLRQMALESIPGMAGELVVVAASPQLLVGNFFVFHPV
jgi:hypothetical protein